MADKPIYNTKGFKSEDKDVEQFKKQEPWSIEKKIRGLFADPMKQAIDNKKEKPFGS